MLRAILEAMTTADYRFDAGRAKAAAQMLMGTFNVDASESGLADTPDRVAKFYEEFNRPVDLRKILSKPFLQDFRTGSLVVETNIPFRGLCEHHLLPFFGTAALGYIPTTTGVVGLSKMTRLVQAAGTRRPSIQERIASDIVDVFDEVVKPKGVMLVITAMHTCMAVRGVNAPNVWTTTSTVRGVFETRQAARAEFLSIIYRPASGSCD